MAFVDDPHLAANECQLEQRDHVITPELGGDRTTRQHRETAPSRGARAEARTITRYQTRA